MDCHLSVCYHNIKSFQPREMQYTAQHSRPTHFPSASQHLPSSSQHMPSASQHLPAASQHQASVSESSSSALSTLQSTIGILSASLSTLGTPPVPQTSATLEALSDSAETQQQQSPSSSSAAHQISTSFVKVKCAMALDTD